MKETCGHLHCLFIVIDLHYFLLVWFFLPVYLWCATCWIFRENRIYIEIYKRSQFYNRFVNQYFITGFYKISSVFLQKPNKGAKWKTTSFCFLFFKEHSSVQMSDLTLHGEDVTADGSDGCLSQWWFGTFLSLTLGSGHQTDMRHEQLCWCGSTPQLMDVQWRQEETCFWKKKRKQEAELIHNWVLFCLIFITNN